MTDSKIHIFYACDDAFVKFTAVSIASLMKNASRRYTYHIHILYTDIREDSMKTLLSMQRERFRISFDSVSDYLASVSGTLPLRDYYSHTTYFRVFIAEMFPELRKAIYIDSDTVVTGDISELYAQDIENYNLGAVKEEVMLQVDVFGTYVEKCLGLDRRAYFNAGVLLINCRRFREKRVLKAFTDMLGVYDFRVTQDEDYLNLICKDHVLFLDGKWNTEVFGEIKRPIEEAAILHYIMAEKPWHYEDCRHGDIFWQYAAETAFYDEIREALERYTDRERARDRAAGERLRALAVEETNRPDNYLKRLVARRDPGRLAILKKIERYERSGRFDEDVEDDPPTRPIEAGEVDYFCKKPMNRVKRRLAFEMAHRFVADLEKKEQFILREIRGIEHMDALETGAVVTCNHFSPFDSFAIQKAYESSKQFKKKKKEFYRIIREGNYTSFPGFYGFLMRHCNTLPLASAPTPRKEFVKATCTLLRDGHLVLIYPEQSMWWNYRKPKPMKSGGFYFAARNHVPVLPCFITMRDSGIVGEDGFPVEEYTVHIGEPIYPESALRTPENTELLMERNYAVWKEIYEKEYGIPLTYLTDAET